MQHKTALVIPDCHIPFEDKSAYATMLKICKPLNISAVYILGDYIDMYGVSEYDKNPELGDLAELYTQEIFEGNERLDELSDLFPKAEKHFLEGNHEVRLSKFIAKNAPALRKTITLESQLKFEQRKDFTWHPFTSRQAVQVMGLDLYARHCPYTTGSPYANAKIAGDSFIYGHTHQLGFESYTTKLSGRKIIAINGGWLGDEKAPVFDYVKNQPDWTKAFTLVHSLEGSWDFETVKIGAKGTRFHGKIY